MSRGGESRKKGSVCVVVTNNKSCRMSRTVATVWNSVVDCESNNVLLASFFEMNPSTNCVSCKEPPNFARFHSRWKKLQYPHSHIFIVNENCPCNYLIPRDQKLAKNRLTLWLSQNQSKHTKIQGHPEHNIGCIFSSINVNDVAFRDYRKQLLMHLDRILQ